MVGILFVSLGFCFGPFDSNPYLTPSSTPETSVWVNWNTSSQGPTVVAYGVSPSLGDTVRVSGTTNYHHALITGLTPNTRYYYKIIPGGSLRHFRTFANTDSFKFIAFGDTRSDSANHQRVINRMTHYDFSLLTHSGDLVSRGYNEWHWQTFFNCEDTVISYKQFLPAIGNHEYPYWPFETLFALPGNGRYYSVNYGNAHFVTLNTQENLSGSQKTWLINDLDNANNNSNIDWIIVTLHRPPYSSSGHGSQMDVRNTWCPIFESHKVDLVFCGHDHDYERTVPINGVVYVVTGGGGAPLYNAGSSSWTAYSRSIYHFCHLTIEDRKLTMRAIDRYGNVFDTLVIDKTAAVKEKKNNNINYLRTNIQPNPFVDRVIIRWSPVFNKDVRVSIFDCCGRLCKTIGDISSKGSIREVVWDGNGRDGRPVEPGVYFLTIETDEGRAVKKIIKLRK